MYFLLLVVSFSQSVNVNVRFTVQHFHSSTSSSICTAYSQCRRAVASGERESLYSLWLLFAKMLNSIYFDNLPATKMSVVWYHGERW